MAIKSVQDIGIVNVEFFRNGGSRGRQVAKCVDDQHICSVGVALAFINKVERFIRRVNAVCVCISPASLVMLQDQLIRILQDRMIDGAGLDSSGVHFETAKGTEPDSRMCFESDDFCNVGDSNV